MASTILHEQGYAHHAIELQLAQIASATASAAYNHALYLKERRVMMCDHLLNHLDKTAARDGGRMRQKKTGRRASLEERARAQELVDLYRLAEQSPVGGIA